jgi:protein required for attachment to host cells
MSPRAKVSIDPRIAVLVADRCQAQMYCARAPRAPLVELEHVTNPGGRLRERDRVSDAPGRVVNAGLHASVPMPRVSATNEDAERFARLIAERLERHRVRGKFNRLYLIAESGFLGRLRRNLAPAMLRLVVHSVARRLTHCAVPEIRRHLPDAL